MHTEHQTIRTSKLLRTIIEDYKDDKVSLSDFLSQLSDRGFSIGILIFAIPNSIPLGIPGISTICAIPIILFALQMIMGRTAVWIPHWLGKYQFSTKTLASAIRIANPYLERIERIIKPRAFMFSNGFAERIIGVMILVLAGIIFLPIPFGNALPAICMCLIAMGLLENDGLMIIGAFFMSILTIIGMSYAIVQVYIQLLNLSMKILS